MIRVNGSNYSNHNITADHIVIDITSSYDSSDDVLKYIIDHAGELPDGTTVKYYIEADKATTSKHFKLPDSDVDKPLYDSFVTDDTISNLDDHFETPDNTKGIRSSFDQFDRQYLNHEHDFVETEIPVAEFVQCCSDALGIIPTLMNEDIPSQDKIKYSKMSKDLMWRDFMSEVTGTSYRMWPALSDIQPYEKMTPYERRVVKCNNIHPLVLIRIYQKLQEINRGQIFTRDVLNQYKDLSKLPHNDGYEKDLLDSTAEVLKNFGEYDTASNSSNKLVISTIFPPIAENIETTLDNIFKEKVGRSPRILHEIALALYISHRVHADDIDRFCNNYVDKFSVPSIQKIARYHSAALLAVSDILNFSEVPDDHIMLFASYMDATKAEMLQDKGFFDWYKGHKNVNTNDLLLIMEQAHLIDHFELDKDPIEVLYAAGQKKGMEEAEGMERRYHYHFLDNDIAIKGKDIVVSDDKYTILMLQSKDYRNFTVGYDSNCCQHFQGAGESCVWKLTADPFAANMVIVKNEQIKNGQWVVGPCVGQAFCWTDENKSTIVFDNMEFARIGAENFDKKVKEFNDIIGAWANEMPYDNVHIGVGYNAGMAGWGKPLSTFPNMKAQVPQTIPKQNADDVSYWSSDAREAGIYTDYHTDARIIKKDGEVLLKANAPENIKVQHIEVDESKYEALKGFEWAIGITDEGLDKDIEFVEIWQENPTDEMKIKAFRRNPELIKIMDSSPLSIQTEIAATRPELIPYIKNPSPSIWNTLIANSPYSIFDIDNPSAEAWKIACSKNGLLLEKCPYDNRDIKIAAVKQNGIAIKFILRPDAELQRLAVTTSKEAISFIVNPTHEAVSIATGKDTTLVSNLSNLSLQEQMNLVNQKPANILSINDPDERAIRYALGHDGLLIKNFKHASLDLQLIAARQNGFSVRYMPQAPKEVLEEAYRQNPKSIKYMRLTPEEKQQFISDMEQQLER